MKGSLDDELKAGIKKLVAEECNLSVDPAGIGDDEPLFGGDSRLGLDSLDALQVSIAAQKRYGLSAADGKKMRKVMRSINTFADFIQPR